MAANDEKPKSDHHSEAIQSARPAKDVDVNIQAQAPLEVADAEPAQTGIQKEPPVPAVRSGSGASATFLIGKEFRTPKSWPWINVIFGSLTLAVGGFLLLLGLLKMYGGAVVVSAFFFVSSLLCFFIRPVCRVSFGERAIQTYRPRQTLDYQEIMQVYAPERNGNENFDIYLLHAYGYLLIPKTIQTQSESIYKFLQEQALALRENPPVPVFMLTYLNREVAAHGADQIHVYRSHLQLKKPYSSRRLEYVTGGMFFGGFLGLCLSGAMAERFGFDNPVAIAVMFLFVASLILGGFGYVAASFTRWGGEVRLWFEKETVLVVSPSGLAAMQGNTSILLSWAELRHANVGLDVQESSSRPALTVWKGGLRIRVRDNLHWPLRHAIAQIRAFVSASGDP